MKISCIQAVGFSESRKGRIMEEDWRIILSVLESPQKEIVGKHKVFTTSPITIGRADNNDMVVPDPTVSRNHSILRITNDYTRVFITDMSTHGTIVSGKTVPKGRGSGFTLENGDTVKMGETVLRFELKLRDSLQQTMIVNKFDLDEVENKTPAVPVEKGPVTDDETVIEEEAIPEEEYKQFSPLYIGIIIICILLLAYLVFWG